MKISEIAKYRNDWQCGRICNKHVIDIHFFEGPHTNPFFSQGTFPMRGDFSDFRISQTMKIIGG